MKLMNAAKKYGRKVAVGTGLALVGGSAMAQSTGPDYSAITGAANWSSVATGIVTVLAAVALVYVALTGGKKLLSAFRA